MKNLLSIVNKKSVKKMSSVDGSSILLDAELLFTLA